MKRRGLPSLLLIALLVLSFAPSSTSFAQGMLARDDATPVVEPDTSVTTTDFSGDVATEDVTEEVTQDVTEETTFEASDSDHITICHALGNGRYNQIAPDASGVYNGHMGHSRDIIPPFWYQGQQYSKNWDAEGQAIWNNGCSVPPTPTNTPRPTRTPTATNTPRPTNTATATATNTATATATNTATATATNTATATATNTATNTPTNTPTNTATATSTNTATATSTATNTAVPTATNTPDDDHVTICHSLGNGRYNQISPDASGVYNGHMGHRRDIIPPFWYQGQQYSKNWDAEGQAIWNNGCSVPPTPTNTPRPTRTPTMDPCVTPEYEAEGQHHDRCKTPTATATNTATATATNTATATATATATNTATATATNTATATATNTATATATNTPEPTATATPHCNTTPTPEPVGFAAQAGTIDDECATATPEPNTPTATSEPNTPTATAVPNTPTATTVPPTQEPTKKPVNVKTLPTTGAGDTQGTDGMPLLLIAAGILAIVLSAWSWTVRRAPERRKR